MPDRMVSAREFAPLVGFKPKTITDYCRRGLIPGARKATEGAPWRIPLSSVERLGELPEVPIPPRNARSQAARKANR